MKKIPAEWMKTIFVEIPKNNGTIKCEKHRTIALIPHAMKIMSKVIYNRISAGFFEQLDTLQYGFRPKVGTVESIALLKTILANRINTKQDIFIFHRFRESL